MTGGLGGFNPPPPPPPSSPVHSIVTPQPPPQLFRSCCVADPPSSFFTIRPLHHITSHHITSHHITSHHIDIDFQRAFDSVSHPKLLHKLQNYGIDGNLLFWISSFLTGRRQSVKIGSSFSKFSPVSSGVPQGSVLGPILFNLFVNDITDNLDNTTTSKMFADDIKIYSEFDTNTTTCNLQTHLDLIYKWSSIWQLTISQPKCNILFLGHHEIKRPLNISTFPLRVSNLIVDLGISIDPELKFSIHIHEIAARAKQRAALIHRCFLSRSSINLLRAFKTYVRPLVEYATQIWSPHFSSLIILIEGVQRSFTKRLPGLSNLTYAERLTTLKLQSLEHRRLIFDLVMCFEIVHGLNALKFDDFFTFPNLSTTRGHPLKLATPIAKKDVKKYFFFTRIIPIWNALPSDFVMANSTIKFKQVRKELQSNSHEALFSGSTVTTWKNESLWIQINE